MNRLKGLLILNLVRLLGHAPLSLARAFGLLIARICWYVGDSSANVTKENIEHCFPELSSEARKHLAKRSLFETGKLAGEICYVWHQDPKFLKKMLFNVVGQDLMHAAVLKGKGVIVLAPHLGNWELLGLCVADYGKLMCLYQPPKHEYLEGLLKSCREREGTEIVPTNRRGIVSLLTHLKKGGVTGILPDQSPEEGSGEFVPFFGIDTYTMSLIHGLLQRTQCQVVFGYVLRRREGFELHFQDVEEDIYNEDQYESLAAMNRGIEACVRNCPEQYQWEYKRFKKRKPGQEKMYKKRKK